MKPFIIKIALFSILTLLMIVSLSSRISESEEESYVSGIIQKHKRLDSLTGSRIIIAGGSNCAFGIDSKAIEDSFHLPVINLALHAGLGLDFVLGELKSVIKEDDIVFISPEYYADGGRYSLLKTAAYYYPEADQYFPHTFSKDWTNFVESRFDQIKTNKGFLISMIKTRITGAKPPASVYSGTSFNMYGDVVAHLNADAPPSLNDKTILTYTYWDGIGKLNMLEKYAAVKKARLFFLFPAYAKSAYVLNKETLERYQTDVQKGLHIPVLNTVEDFVYDDSDFFDTVYHLRKGSREKRTGKLIAIIEAHPEILKSSH